MHFHGFFLFRPTSATPSIYRLPRPNRRENLRHETSMLKMRAAGSADKAELPEIGGAPETEAAPSLDTRLLSIIARPVKNRQSCP